jgi:hypothetical protein
MTLSMRPSLDLDRQDLSADNKPLNRSPFREGENPWNFAERLGLLREQSLASATGYGPGLIEQMQRLRPDVVPGHLPDGPARPQIYWDRYAPRNERMPENWPVGNP